MTHANDPMPNGIFAWDELSKATDAAAAQPQAHFTFNLTNISSGNVAIMNVHPSCGCTTALIADVAVDRRVPAGANGQIPITVNVAGKSGTLFKYVEVSTDKGLKRLMLRINILPPVVVTLSDARARATNGGRESGPSGGFQKRLCDVPRKTGWKANTASSFTPLACGICHEAEHRATMVPRSARHQNADQRRILADIGSLTANPARSCPRLPHAVGAARSPTCKSPRSRRISILRPQPHAAPSPQ